MRLARLAFFNARSVNSKSVLLSSTNRISIGSPWFIRPRPKPNTHLAGSVDERSGCVLPGRTQIPDLVAEVRRAGKGAQHRVPSAATQTTPPAKAGGAVARSTAERR